MSDLYQRIINFNKGRLPDMLKLKYEGMTEDIFRFFRGTCHLYYEDLSKVNDFPDSPVSWTCGDLHLENFGSYKGDDRMVYFDLDDFDEAILAPCLWEVSRILASIFIAFENLDLKEKEAIAVASQFINHYSVALAGGKAKSIDPRTAKGIVRTFLDKVEKRKQKELLKKRTITKKHKLLLSLQYEKHLELERTLKKDLEKHIDEWIKTSHLQQHGFKAEDCVFRIAGTGSIGVKRYLFLLKSGDKKNKYLLLDMKQAMPSSLQPYVTIKQPQWKTEADRVVRIQHRMQNVSPALLATTIFKDDCFVVQEMQPTEDSINFELIKERHKDINQVIEDMAVLTASSQLRAAGRQGSDIADKLMAFGQSTSWQEKLLDYAEKYAAQVKKDYKEYVKLYKEGKFN